MTMREYIALGGILLLGACTDGGEEDAAAVEGGYIQAHSTQQLMEVVIQPTAEMYWDSVQYISDETGNHDISPQTDEDWTRTRMAAASISEFGNLLMTPLYAEGRGEDWIEFSQGMVEVGKLAEQAAVERDTEKVFEVGGTVYNVCSACHQVYPPSELPEGTTEADFVDGPTT